MSAFTNSLCLPTNFKSTFNYYSVFDTAVKIDFARPLIIRGKTDREWLLRFEWRKKLDAPYAGKLTFFAPLEQRCQYFVEDHHPRYKWGTGKMSG